MRRAFTLIELLAIVAILATMVSIGVGSLLSGQGTARVKGATRDVYAAIRQARSIALVTGQQVLVNYSNEKFEDEATLKIEIVAAKIMNTDANNRIVQPYWITEYKNVPQAKSPETSGGNVSNKKHSQGETETAQSGETIEEILFSPMNATVIKGMRIKVLKGNEALKDETVEQARSRISVFSNVDYLQNRYKEAKAEEAKKTELAEKATDSTSSGSINDMNEMVSVVWETNGAVDPHRIWVYPDGKKPEDGLVLNVDQFGAIKVISGDGREED